MTPTEKQKTIAEQAVYGDLQVSYKDIPNPDKVIGCVYDEISVRYSNGDTWRLPILHSKLILRNLSDLTKEITHDGYNDDKPFVPLVELAKVYYPNCISYNLANNDTVICNYHSHGVDYDFNQYDEDKLCLRQCEHDILHLWHFDTRNLIEQGEAIDANSLPKNPYEV